MSAFMMSAKTLAVLAKASESIAANGTLNGIRVYIDEDSKSFLRHAVAKMTDSLVFDWRGIYRVLEDMNARALHEKYGDNPDDLKRDAPDRCPSASTMQIYKWFQCYLYQCAEGDVDKSRLYTIVKKVSDGLANGIVSGLPAYQEAAWSE